MSWREVHHACGIGLRKLVWFRPSLGRRVSGLRSKAFPAGDLKRERCTDTLTKLLLSSHHEVSLQTWSWCFTLQSQHHKQQQQPTDRPTDSYKAINQSSTTTNSNKSKKQSNCNSSYCPPQTLNSQAVNCYDNDASRGHCQGIAQCCLARAAQTAEMLKALES